MEEKDADLWWDVMKDIIQIYIGKVYRMYERNRSLIGIIYLRWKRSYHHFNMNL
jgi:hypothetical protein